MAETTTISARVYKSQLKEIERLARKLGIWGEPLKLYRKLSRGRLRLRCFRCSSIGMTSLPLQIFARREKEFGKENKRKAFGAELLFGEAL